MKLSIMFLTHNKKKAGRSSWACEMGGIVFQMMKLHREEWVLRVAPCQVTGVTAMKSAWGAVCRVVDFNSYFT